MFTDCPGCCRQFRVSARHLTAAAGEVRCGFCGRQFNALQRLRDRPLPASALTVDSGSEPEFEIPEQSEAVVSEPQNTRVDELQVLAADVAESVEDISAADDVATVTGPDFDFPPQLAAAEPEKRGTGVHIVWTLALLLVVLALLLQVLWFRRDEVLLRYPQVRPWFSSVCTYFHCQLIRNRDITMFQLLSRDVRLHPRFRDALLINATIKNTAAHLQPFPHIQLLLYDSNGRLIAYRDFAPADYLDDSIDDDAGMLPGMAMHIALEVHGPAEDAVGFEFRFL